MVTAGTYLKQHYFVSPERLSLLCDKLLELAEASGWNLQAWAVLSNHYHFAALPPERPESLRPFLQRLHSLTAREINRQDQTPGRKVWFQFWETRLTYPRSYFARLAYVHRNAVHHGLVREPSAYRWCSAAWFERNAGRAFYSTIMNFPCDALSLADDY